MNLFLPSSIPNTWLVELWAELTKIGGGVVSQTSPRLTKGSFSR
jgi:hypothetical protein